MILTRHPHGDRMADGPQDDAGNPQPQPQPDGRRQRAIQDRKTPRRTRNPIGAGTLDSMDVSSVDQRATGERKERQKERRRRERDR